MTIPVMTREERGHDNPAPREDSGNDTAGADMTEKQPSPSDVKGKKQGAADKQSRLAAALRRNLAKRKDAKEAKNVDNP